MTTITCFQTVVTSRPTTTSVVANNSRNRKTIACAQHHHQQSLTTTTIHDEDDRSIKTDKLSYEIFSIVETRFLFGYDHDPRLWLPPKHLPNPPAATAGAAPEQLSLDAEIKSQRVCVLSIDGGGMRGILSGKALTYLERALRTKSGDPDARVSDYFDVAAGTGVGGIFAAMLFAARDGRRLIFAAEDTWRMLADQGRKFYGKREGGEGGGGGGFLKRILRVGGITAEGREMVCRHFTSRAFWSLEFQRWKFVASLCPPSNFPASKQTVSHPIKN